MKGIAGSVRAAMSHGHASKRVGARRMSNWIRQSQAGRGLFALLLLCALAVRVVVPNGFMPVQGIDGIVVTLCTDQGMVKAVVPIDKGGEPADHGKSKSGECTFASGLGGGLLVATTSTVDAAPALTVARLASRAIADVTVHRLAAPPPPSHGPPAHS